MKLVNLLQAKKDKALQEEEGLKPKTTIYKNQKYISHIIYLTVILLWVTVFHHTLYENFPSEVKEADLIHKQFKKARNDASNASFPLIHKFADGELSKEEFIEEAFNLENEFLDNKEKSALQFKKVKNLESNYQVFGFNNYNIFSFQLSERIVLFLCVLFLIISIRIKSKSQILVKALNFGACNMLIICAFYTIWVFYKGDDLSITAYYTFMLITALISGISVYYLINAIYKKINNDIKKNKEVILRNQEIGLDIKLAFDLLAKCKFLSK